MTRLAKYVPTRSNQLHIDARHVQAHMDVMSMNTDRVANWHIPEDMPLFTMMTVARAANVTANTLRAWFQRGHVELGSGDTKSQLNGFPSKFTLRSVCTVAVTAELVRLGMPPRAAFEAAEHWTLFGDIEGQLGAPATRQPGGLFPSPYSTFLVTAADGGSNPQGLPCQIVGINPRDPQAHGKWFNALFARGRVSGRMVYLNLLVAHVREVCKQSIVGNSPATITDWERLAGELGELPEAGGSDAQ